MWLDESTVRTIFKRLAQRKVDQRRSHGKLTHLGIDEISLRKGHKRFALVLSDLKRRRGAIPGARAGLCRLERA